MHNRVVPAPRLYFAPALTDRRRRELQDMNLVGLGWAGLSYQRSKQISRRRTPETFTTYSVDRVSWLAGGVLAGSARPTVVVDSVSSALPCWQGGATCWGKIRAMIVDALYHLECGGYSGRHERCRVFTRTIEGWGRPEYS